MPDTVHDLVVLGAGISGLATANWLRREGLDIHILEPGTTPGGTMISRVEQGYRVDFGPNSGLETSPYIRELAKDAGIEEQMMYAGDAAQNRYILRDGKLHALPMGPGSFMKTKLFSTSAKLRLLKEPFVGRSDDGYYQSIADFVKRRLGQEFLDYAINPFVSGVSAGDPDKLSVKSAFPKLYRLEEKYGGLIKGMIKGAKERKRSKEESKQSAKMFSFRDGMQSLPVALTALFKDAISYNSRVVNVAKGENGLWTVTYRSGEETKTIRARSVLSTAPAFETAEYLGSMDEELAKHLNKIVYPKVMVLMLGYPKSAFDRSLDGFGFLIPALEKKIFLGAIWSSSIFPNRAPEGKALFTLFVGGASQEGLFNIPEEKLVPNVIREFNEVMGSTAEPELITHKLWENAIPQYNIGYIEHENYFKQFEEQHPGIFLSGNYRGGNAIGDCVKNSKVNAERILEFHKTIES